MSCDGGETCKCGCDEGNCTCKKVPLQKAWDVGMMFVDLIPLSAPANAVIQYISDLIRFPLRVMEALQFHSMEMDLIKEKQDTNMSDFEYTERLGQIYYAEQLYDKQKAIRARKDEEVTEEEAKSSIETFFAEVSSKLLENSPVYQLQLIIDMKKIGVEIDKLFNCDCEPCGEDEDVDPLPTPGNPGGGEGGGGSGANPGGGGGSGSNPGGGGGSGANPGGGGGDGGPSDPKDPNGGTGGSGDGKPHNSPIILNLDGNLSNDTVSLEDSSTYFDIKNREIFNRIGWVGNDDGILFYDKNTNGKFDGTSELFGASGQNGFDELAGYDINGDGFLVQDKNGNGKVDGIGELFGNSSVNSIDAFRLYSVHAC